MESSDWSGSPWERKYHSYFQGKSYTEEQTATVHASIIITCPIYIDRYLIYYSTNRRGGGFQCRIYGRQCSTTSNLSDPGRWRRWNWKNGAVTTFPGHEPNWPFMGLLKQINLTRFKLSHEHFRLQLKNGIKSLKNLLII